MFLAKKSPKNIFFMRDLKRSDIRYLQSELEETPFFIIADNEEMLLFLDSIMEENRLSKPIALYTNCTVLIKALHRLFMTLWDNSASSEKASNSLF